MYAVIGTRMDLAHTIILLSQFNVCPTSEHLTAVRHCLRHLNGTRNLKLFYPKGRELKLEGYCDASFASCPDTRRSYSGNAFRLADCTITWKSQKQKCVTVSTTEAEYLALSLRTRQMVWLKRGLKELRFVVPCALFTDSEGASDIAENPKINERTKHIDVAYHNTREKLLSGVFFLFRVASINNPADLMTKPLGKTLHNRHVGLLTNGSDQATDSD